MSITRYNIVRDGILLGVIDIDYTFHQPIYKITNIDGIAVKKMSTFKNDKLTRDYVEWAYPGARLVKVTA